MTPEEKIVRAAKRAWEAANPLIRVQVKRPSGWRTHRAVRNKEFALHLAADLEAKGELVRVIPKP